MKSQAIYSAAAVILTISGVFLNAQTGQINLRFETHRNLQAVTETGTSAWSGSFPFTVVGVLLTDPEEMLDPTPNFLPYNDGENLGKMGGELQIVVQAVLPGDRGGTVCWMGQNYGNLPWIRNSDKSYPNEVWAAEVNRLKHDPVTGRAFRKGDLVMITANRSLFYGGKRNINEAHDISPEADFYINLVQAGFGLPEPEVISLASVVRPDDGDPNTKEDIFDASRNSGGEYYQGMRVRITGIQLVTTDGWDQTKPWAQRKCTVTDGEGRYFTLRHPRYSLGPAPTGKFDAIGVFNQESGSGSDGTFGYELFVQEIAPATEPSLAVSRKVVITWNENFSNYRVLYKDNLSGGQWMPLDANVYKFGNVNAILLDPVNESKFFKLERFK